VSLKEGYRLQNSSRSTQLALVVGCLVQQMSTSKRPWQDISFSPLLAPSTCLHDQSVAGFLARGFIAAILLQQFHMEHEGSEKVTRGERGE
jgi:hypothetical protein